MDCRDGCFVGKKRDTACHIVIGEIMGARSNKMDAAADRCTIQPAHGRAVIRMDHEIDFDEARGFIERADGVDAGNRPLPRRAFDFEAHSEIGPTPWSRIAWGNASRNPHDRGNRTLECNDLHRQPFHTGHMVVLCEQIVSVLDALTVLHVTTLLTFMSVELV
jgi:hypothetical protein